MTLSRRTAIASGLTGVAAFSAGCLDFVLGNESLEFEAEQAAPTDSALEETGFEELEIRSETIEESVEAAGVEREVTATIQISSYTKEIDILDNTEEAMAFAAVSTPDMTVAGESFNPIADMDNEEILNEFLTEMESDAADINNIRSESTTTVSSLDESRDAELLRGDAELRGSSVEIEILMSTFSHEDDYLVVVGSYPVELKEQQTEDIESLFGAVEHPV